MKLFKTEGLVLMPHNIECIRTIGEDVEVTMVSGRTYHIAHKKLSKRLRKLSVPLWKRILRRIFG